MNDGRRGKLAVSELLRYVDMKFLGGHSYTVTALLFLLSYPSKHGTENIPSDSDLHTLRGSPFAGVGRPDSDKSQSLFAYSGIFGRVDRAIS